METKTLNMETIHPTLSLVNKFEVPECHQLILF